MIFPRHGLPTPATGSLAVIGAIDVLVVVCIKSLALSRPALNVIHIRSCKTEWPQISTVARGQCEPQAGGPRPPSEVHSSGM